MSPHFSLGVDVLEWKKAKKFYKAHADKLHEIFTPSERRFVRDSAKPHEAFAMVFAAREASFKALGRACPVIPKTATRFKVSGRPRLAVTIRKDRRHVVACCHKSSS